MFGANYFGGIYFGQAYSSVPVPPFTILHQLLFDSEIVFEFLEFSQIEMLFEGDSDITVELELESFVPEETEFDSEQTDTFTENSFII